MKLSVIALDYDDMIVRQDRVDPSTRAHPRPLFG